MPAANRPRRSPRVKPTEEIPEKEDPPLVIPKKKAKKSQSVKENEYDDLDDGSDGSSDDGDPVSKPWQKNKSKKSKESQEVPVDPNAYAAAEPIIIPKRKKRERDPPPIAAPKIDEIKRKKKKEADDKATSKSSSTTSLIANMAPANSSQRRQPAIRDWKSKDDYKAFVSRTRDKPSGGNLDGRSNLNASAKMSAKTKAPPGNQHQLPVDKQIRSASSSSNNPHVKRIELGNKIRKELNGLIFKVLESESASKGKKIDEFSSSSSAMALLGGVGRLEDLPVGKKERGDGKDKSSNAIDWSGSFLPTSNEEEYDFGEFDERPPVPMFPEDFSSKRKEWPLGWWGIVPPSNELLDMHDGGSRSKRERERLRDKEKEREKSSRGRDGDKSSRDRDFERGRGWRDDRRGGGPGPDDRRGGGPGPDDRRGGGPGPGGPPYRGDGRYDYRGPPPVEGHYHGPPPPRGGGWQEQRMHDDGWRGGGGGRGFGPGPNRRGHGPGFGGRGPQTFPRRM